MSDEQSRYDHVCANCGEKFSNIVKECQNCCVCEIRLLREEWDEKAEKRDGEIEERARCVGLTRPQWWRPEPTQCSHRAIPGSRFCKKHQEKGT